MSRCKELLSGSLETLQFRGIARNELGAGEGGVRFSTGSCVNTMGPIGWKCKPIPRVYTRRAASSALFYTTLSPSPSHLYTLRYSPLCSSPFPPSPFILKLSLSLSALLLFLSSVPSLQICIRFRRRNVFKYYKSEEQKKMLLGYVLVTGNFDWCGFIGDRIVSSRYRGKKG